MPDKFAYKRIVLRFSSGGMIWAIPGLLESLQDSKGAGSGASGQFQHR